MDQGSGVQCITCVHLFRKDGRCAWHSMGRLTCLRVMMGDPSFFYTPEQVNAVVTENGWTALMI